MLMLALVQCAFVQESGKVRLIGVGTTSALAVYAKWFQAFERNHPDLDIMYIPSGSGTGIKAVTSGGADFGATDIPMAEKVRAKEKMLQIATVLGAVVPIYNLPGSAGILRFSPSALAGIYLGTITRWNDPAIAGPNQGVDLPSAKISVVHSTDGRGATYIWSDYLSKVSAEWRSKVGRGISVDWPVGKAADGNGQVARMVKETQYSIGFVELIYAVQSRLAYGQVQNAAGNFVIGDVASVTAAATASTQTASAGARASITNSRGEKAYPISSFTWILVPEEIPSDTKREAMKDFLRWALDQGQDYAETAGFARLPKAVAEQQLSEIENIR
jgi:phosphate transport system substrate-binding protein